LRRKDKNDYNLCNWLLKFFKAKHIKDILNLFILAINNNENIKSIKKYSNLVSGLLYMYLCPNWFTRLSNYCLAYQMQMISSVSSIQYKAQCKKCSHGATPHNGPMPPNGTKATWQINAQLSPEQAKKYTQSHTKQWNCSHNDVVNNNGIWRHQQRTKSCWDFRKLHPRTLKNLSTSNTGLM